MEDEHEMDGEQVIVEEVIDESEVYDDGQGYGEELYLDNDGLEVEGLPPGEYVQLESGEIVPASQLRAHSGTRTVQQARPPLRRPMQNENSSTMNRVYAISGSQVFRLDKNASRVPQKGVKTEPPMKAESSVDPSLPSSSTGYAYNRFQSFRRDSSNFGLTVPIPKPKKKPMTGSRKPCNCTKSMCLKLYCECFANGEFCRDCNCKDCHNNLSHEGERTRAIKSSLERNPNAFKPKIISGIGNKGKNDADRLHTKGCHCKKSNCLKNYCECYEAKVPCTDRCKCCGCKNTENDRASKFRDRVGPAALLSLANVASLTDSRTDTPFSDDESDGESEEKRDPKTMPWFYLTDEVVEASTLCLVAQAEQLERESGGDASEEAMERILMAEFSNCLQSIIQSASDSAAAAKVAKQISRLEEVHEGSPSMAMSPCLEDLQDL